MVRSHQQEYHNSPASVVCFRSQHRSGLPQQTQTAEVGLQADLIRVSEDLPQAASVAHTGCFRFQGDSSNNQVHDLESRPPHSGNQRPRLLLGSGDLVVPPGPSHSSSTGEGLTAADHGDSGLPRVDRSNVVASAGQTKDRNGSDLSACGSRLPQVW